MKKTTKIALIIACLAVAAAMFAGCSENKTLKVGIIQFATHPSLDDCYNGLIAGLEAAGYTDRDNIKIDYQNAQASSETSDQIAKNMAANGYDVIVGIATSSAVSAFSAARDDNIPVVFCAVSDPVAAQLVQSLDMPGGNCTGTSDKLNIEGQLKMIRAMQPEAKKIGILYTTSEANSVSHLETIKELAPVYGFEIVATGVNSASDIPQAAASLVAKVDCVNNFTDNNVVDNLQVLLSAANDAGIPVYGSEIQQVKNGCLASETIDYVNLGEVTGTMVAKILNGENASDIPVGVISQSYPVINTDVAEKFNITIPDAYASAERVATAK